ncbi:hypothetical protein Pyrfu_0572 [Pyrolobus fumarii 1A]|uniref:DUF2299 domain-containing protein n=1 Tax=Pyrolobus fumarii (strain DSM 11204 / 1A) TaxID=694429 RepID=G0EGZ2_PYRF1|nr:DUF2299 family protein [Pyrolobus fumarii]AEM38442.1 hypothetical protein Pyrfu_0572 [Pyrolobus fumarii 1A]
MQSLIEQVESVARKAGLRVEEPRGVAPPPGMEWVRDIIAEGPGIRVVVRVAGSERDRRLVLIMPIGFSEVHMRLIQGLPLEERMALLARLLREVIHVCPYCRVGVGGAPTTPQGIIAEIHYVDGVPDSQRLLDDITRLISVFMAVNTVLWERFPGTMPGHEKPQLYT